jgi:hypothetical protein
VTLAWPMSLLIGQDAPLSGWSVAIFSAIAIFIAFLERRISFLLDRTGTRDQAIRLVPNEMTMEREDVEAPDT